MRSTLGLAQREKALSFIEDAWLNATQRERISADQWNLYQDHQTDPESHAVEAVGRGNLLGLIAQGYDGKSAQEIRNLVERGTAVSLLLQDPSGQCPPNGRTDDHVFNDVLYQLSFDAMAERARRSGDKWPAGQYRHAAMLSFQSIERWRRRDGAWAGSFFVTKNRFDPADRVGYQPASNYGNYNGAVMLHLAAAYLARATDIPEAPAPVEIGGYAFATDARFAGAVANAGGMQLFAALRGDPGAPGYGQYWTALGVRRLGRVRWDTRLGPSDGIRDGRSGRGVTFAPTWLLVLRSEAPLRRAAEDGNRVRLADVPQRYRGHFSVQFAHPLLARAAQRSAASQSSIRCAVDYRPIKGKGPSFRHEFLLTPDGVPATLTSDVAGQFAVSLPVLENDGTVLRTGISPLVATTSFAANADEQSYLAPDPGTRVSGDEEAIRATCGRLRPVLAMAGGGSEPHLRVSPRSRGPSGPEGAGEFSSAEGRLRVAPGGRPRRHLCGPHPGAPGAGGEGTSIDCDGDGKPDVVFDANCRFVLQLRGGKVVAVEADRRVKVDVRGRQIQLGAYSPTKIEGE